MFRAKKNYTLGGYIILLAAPSPHRHRHATSSPMEEPRRKFRLNAKNLFLTWPRNNISSEVILNKLIDLFGIESVSYICVAEEEHQDGTPHLHAVVCLKTACNIRDVAKLDEVGGKHGNYQCCRKVKDVYAYVKKGGNFVERGEPPLIITGTKSDNVAQRIREGGSLDSVEEMDPGFFLQNMQKITQYYNWMTHKKQRQLEPRPPLIISSWKFRFEVGMPRHFKQKQYWIWGPRNTGKTSFVLDLVAQGFRGYDMPKNNYWNDYSDEAYDFAYIDEFKGQLTVTFLNEFLQGSPMKLRGRYNDVIKKKNLPVFILSNFDPYGCYENFKSGELDPLVGRLHIIRTE